MAGVPLGVVSAQEADHGGREVVLEALDVDEREAAHAREGIPLLIIYELCPGDDALGSRFFLVGFFVSIGDVAFAPGAAVVDEVEAAERGMDFRDDGVAFGLGVFGELVRHRAVCPSFGNDRRFERWGRRGD